MSVRPPRAGATGRLAAALAAGGLLALATGAALGAFGLSPGPAGLVGLLLAGQVIAFALARRFVLAPLERDAAGAEARAEECVTRLEEAQHIGRIGWWSYDFATDRIEPSPELFNIFGMTRETFPVDNAGFLDLAHPEDRPAILQAFSKGLRNGTGYQVAYRAQVGQETRWIYQRAETTYDARGRALRSVGTIQDISETREAERARSGFVSTVSHELRTPLTSIVGSLSLIRGGALGEVPPKMHAAVDMAAKNSERLSRLIDDILDSERLASGRMAMDMVPLDARDVISEAVQANAAYGATLGVHFVPDLPQEQVDIRGDHDRLVQVMTNLLSNAAKFSYAGDPVHVRLSPPGDRAVIEVVDRGVGIPEHAQSSIFERFTQAHARNERNASSSGLGLSIARAIVEEHCGSLTFESFEASGTTFRVTLPSLSAETKEAGEDRAAA